MKKKQTDIKDISTLLKCPKCGSDEVHRTKRHGIFDQMMYWQGRFPYYCHQHACRNRFFLKFRDPKVIESYYNYKFLTQRQDLRSQSDS